MIACFSWLLLFPRLVFVLGKSGIRSLLVDVISDDRRFVGCFNSDLLVSGDVVLLLLVFPICCHFPVLVFVLGKSGIRSLLVDVISDDRRFVDCLNSDLLVSGDVVLLLLVFPVCCHFPVLVFVLGKNCAITAAMVVDIVSDDRCVFVVAV